MSEWSTDESRDNRIRAELLDQQNYNAIVVLCARKDDERRLVYSISRLVFLLCGEPSQSATLTN